MENNVSNQNSFQDRNIRIYSILAYIGILWIVGLLVKEKDNKTLKFHVGQGMLITILSFIISVFNNVVVSNIFVTTDYVLGVSYRRVTGFGLLIEGALGLCTLALMIIGIVNAANNKEEELPVIGKFSFYK